MDEPRRDDHDEAAQRAEKTHALVTARIQHEDLLLTQRTYNYLTLNVFMGAVFALNYGAGSSLVPGLGGVLAWLGAALSLLQIVFGRRIERTICVWREYLWLIEKVAGMRVDSVLFDFYRSARAETPYGTLVRQKPWQRPMFRTFPWSICPSTNVVVGVVIPWVLCMLWLVAAVTATLEGSAAWVTGSLIAATITCLAFIWPLPAYPVVARPAGDTDLATVAPPVGDLQA